MARGVVVPVRTLDPLDWSQKRDKGSGLAGSSSSESRVAGGPQSRTWTFSSNAVFYWSVAGHGVPPR